MNLKNNLKFIFVNFFYKLIDLLFQIHDFILNYFYKINNKDYDVCDLSPRSQKKLISIFNNMKPCKFTRSSHLTKFYIINYSDKEYEGYNDQHSWYDLREINFKFLIIELTKFITNFTNSNFKVVNIRSFKTVASAKSSGPLKFHTDGFVKGHLKIMIYKDEMNVDNGYLVVRNTNIFTTKKCSAVIFKNSDVFHNGVAGLKSSRHAIEITLQRTFFKYKNITIGLPNDRHLKFPLI